MDGTVATSLTFGEAGASGGRIGRVVASNGSQAIIILDASDQGSGSHGLQIGALVKIPTAQTVVYALVNGLAIPMPKSLGEAELKMVEIELLGQPSQASVHHPGPPWGARRRRGREARVRSSLRATLPCRADWRQARARDTMPRGPAPAGPAHVRRSSTTRRWRRRGSPRHRRRRKPWPAI